MKKISFNCNDVSAELFVEIINKLSSLTNKSRQIRIGGDEWDFLANIDGIQDLTVDDRLYASMTPTEQRAIEVIRANNFQSAILGSPISPVVATVPDSDEDDDPLNSDEAVAVRDVVSSKVSQNQMFTAFDITKQLRNNGNQVHHRNVKEIVHSLFANGEMNGYDRHLINISGAPVQPFLYHPASADFSTYQLVEII